MRHLNWGVVASGEDTKAIHSRWWRKQRITQLQFLECGGMGYHKSDSYSQRERTRGLPSVFPPQRQHAKCERIDRHPAGGEVQAHQVRSTYTPSKGGMIDLSESM